MLIRFIKGILTEYGFHQCNSVYVCTYTYVRMCVYLNTQKLLTPYCGYDE